MKRVAIVIAAVALAMTASTYGATSKGIEGSVHDFSIGTNTLAGVANSTWNTRNGVCSPCHAAHNTDEDQVAPLWVHAKSAGPWTPYSNPDTMHATVGNPNGVSLACLSCHDGTVAVNQLTEGGAYTNGNPSAVFIQNVDADYQIGPDLHTTHPISFVYNTALATADGSLEDPATYKIGDAKTALTITTAPVPASGWTGRSLTGKTIAQAMLFNGGKMQCSSCHDVHKLDGSAPSSGILARLSGTDVDGRGSILCRTCHIK